MAATAAALLPTRTRSTATKTGSGLVPAANHPAPQQTSQQLRSLPSTLPKNPSAIPPGTPGECDAPGPEERHRLRLQRKLAIGASDDPLEAEADRAAEAVMRMPVPLAAHPGAPLRRSFVSASGEPALRRTCACGGSCDKCKEERNERLQRKATADIPPTHAPPAVHDVLRSPGNPLDRETRSFMEARFSRDFSHIRVHTDRFAANSANAVNALAYTVGNQIVFAAGQYRTQSDTGRRLLAHELAHTVQQSGTAAVSSPESNIRFSHAPAMVARETPEEKAAAEQNEILNNIGTAALPAAALGIAPTHPIWGQLAVLWMVPLLQVLEKADRRGYLAALDQHVDGAQGGVKERLRIAIDAVKMKRGKDQVTVFDTAFEKRLQILPEQQRKEIFEYLTGGRAGAAIRVLTPEEKAREAKSPTLEDYLHPPERPKNIPQPAPESALDKFAREHARQIEQLPRWSDHFSNGMAQSALVQKLGESWIELKKDLGSARRFVNFYMGLQIGIPVGAFNDIYNQVEGIAKLLVAAILIKLQFDTDPKKVWQDVKKFGQQIPDMLLRLFDAEQLGRAAGDALAAKVDQEFVKKGPFDQGKAIGEIIGAILMEVALLFVGVEEVSAAAKAVKATVVGEEVARGMALTSRELKLIVEARGALKLEKSLAEGAAKEAKLVEGVDQSAAHAAPPLDAPPTGAAAKPTTPAAAKPDILAGVNPETRTAFSSEAKQPLKKALEDNSRAAKLLKRCQSLCYPDFVTPDQIARLEKILEDAEHRGFQIDFKGLQEELRNPALKTPQDFERALGDVDLKLSKNRDLADVIHDQIGPPRNDRVTPLTPSQTAQMVQERFDRIARFRAQNNLPAYRQLQGSTGTVSLVEAEDQLFFGTNSKLSDSIALSQAERELWFARLKRGGKLKGIKNLSEAQFLSHAEAGSLIKAYERSGADTLPEKLDLFVDRPTCNDCRTNLQELADSLGVKTMHIYYLGQSGPPVLVTGW